MEFRFFANGPVKREYVALSETTIADKESIRELIALSVEYVLTKDPKRVADG